MSCKMRSARTLTTLMLGGISAHAQAAQETDGAKAIPVSLNATYR